MPHLRDTGAISQGSASLRHDGFVGPRRTRCGPCWRLGSSAMEPEALAIRRLRRCGVAVSSERVAHLRAYFADFGRLEAATNLAPLLELREGRWALLGFDLGPASSRCVVRRCSLTAKAAAPPSEATTQRLPQPRPDGGRGEPILIPTGAEGYADSTGKLGKAAHRSTRAARFARATRGFGDGRRPRVRTTCGHSRFGRYSRDLPRGVSDGGTSKRRSDVDCRSATQGQSVGRLRMLY